MANPYGDDLVVDQIIGSAYKVVRYVAANMESLIVLSDNVPELIASIDEMEVIIANLAAIQTVSANITAVNSLYTNMTALLAVYNQLAAIIHVDENMAAVVNVSNNIEQLLDQLSNLAPFTLIENGLVPAPVTTNVRFLRDNGQWDLPLDAVGLSSASGIIDARASQIVQRTLTTNTTINFVNMDSGRSVTLHLASAGFVVTWPLGIKWVNGTEPILTVNDVLVFWQVESQLYGSYVGNIV